MISFFAFIIVLGVLIFFHELGHFLVARLFGVGVEKFSLGFGPKIFGRKVGITDYRISAIPLGGYVKMVGEEPDAEVKPEDIPISFTHKHVSQRILIVLAGPVFNFVLAILIFLGIFLVVGTFVLKPSIGGIEENSPAAEAGIQKGDLILAIDGKEIESWDEMAQLITDSKGKKLALTIQRKEAVIIFDIAPKLKLMPNLFGENIERYIIGITSGGEVFSKRLNPIQALIQSLVRTYEITKLTIVSIVKLIQGTLSVKTLGGPVMIAQMAGEQVKEGIVNFVFFIALLSVNLGVLNLLPIPVLDGGHLFFCSVEWITGRPVNKRVREIATGAGMAVLFLLTMVVFYNDITR